MMPLSPWVFGSVTLAGGVARERGTVSEGDDQQTCERRQDDLGQDGGGSVPGVWHLGRGFIEVPASAAGCLWVRCIDELRPSGRCEASTTSVPTIRSGTLLKTASESRCSRRASRRPTISQLRAAMLGVGEQERPDVRSAHRAHDGVIEGRSANSACTRSSSAVGYPLAAGLVGGSLSVV